MAEISTEILFISLLLLCNGLFAMAEIAMISARKSRLEKRAAEGDHGAKAALELSQSPDRFLSTAQVGITLIGILAGAYGGATLAEQMEEVFNTVPGLAPYARNLSIAIVVVSITFLSVVIGELVPKQIALAHADAIASRVARPMNLLSTAASPLVTLLAFSSRLLLGILRIKPTEEGSVTLEELRQVIRQASGAGVLESSEQDIVERLMVVGDRRIASIMTPRTALVFLDLNDPPGVNWKKVTESGHSFFPVCVDTLDEIKGIVSVKNLWARQVETGDIRLDEVMEKPYFVPETMPLLRLLEQLKATGQPLAMVLDEFGGIDGMVTLSDFTKAILLGVHPQSETEEPWIVLREDGSWLVAGAIPVEDFKEAFDLRELPGESDHAFETLGGFIMNQLGRVPEVADSFVWGGLRFEVVDLDGRRVDMVLVSRIEESPPEDQPVIGL